MSVEEAPARQWAGLAQALAVDDTVGLAGGIRGFQ